MRLFTPVLKNELSGNVGMLELIRRKDRFIHVPYHSFDSYIRILQEAAINKEVKSIKTTLYRLAKDSKVVKALINAARNGNNSVPHHPNTSGNFYHPYPADG